MVRLAAFHGLTGRECSPLHSESPEWLCDKPAHGPADALQSQPAWTGSEVELVPSWSAQAQLGEESWLKHRCVQPSPRFHSGSESLISLLCCSEGDSGFWVGPAQPHRSVL